MFHKFVAFHKLVLFLILSFSISAFSQVFEPVQWSTSIEKISETEYDLIVNATIDSGWHLYSQNVPENGPFQPHLPLKLIKTSN